jgi:hypothetical protein
MKDKMTGDSPTKPGPVSHASSAAQPEKIPVSVYYPTRPVTSLDGGGLTSISIRRAVMIYLLGHAMSIFSKINVVRVELHQDTSKVIQNSTIRYPFSGL